MFRGLVCQAILWSGEDKLLSGRIEKKQRNLYAALVAGRGCIYFNCLIGQSVFLIEFDGGNSEGGENDKGPFCGFGNGAG